MKTLAVVALMLSLGLVQASKAEDQDQEKVPKSPAKGTPNSHPVAPRVMPHVQQPNRPSPYNVPRVNPAQPSIKQPTNQPRIQRDLRVPIEPTVPRAYVPKPPQGTVPIQPNVDARNRKSQDRGNWQNRNWNGQNWNKNNPRTQPRNTITWEDARRRHYRNYHHRDWWRSHYTRFALFGGGYYFWDSGYWYPAYGYDPSYNVYEYEEPIYAYGDLEPADVISNVQTALQNLGYFPYEIDGLMGPMTRGAISNYQRDNGLAITSAIDEPTLESLGLLGE